MTEQDEIEQGREAGELLSNRILKRALNDCRKEIMDMWEATPARDTDGREWLWKLHQASVRFENVLRGYIDTGKIAKANLKEGKTVAEKIRSIM